MNILIILPCADLGGVEQAALRSAILLKARGHRVSLLSLHELAGLERLCAKHDIGIAALPHYYGAGGLLNVFGLVRAIREAAPDRVWCFSRNLGAMIAGRLSGAPTYLSVHYPHARTPAWKLRIVYAAARFCCRKIHFVSRFIFDEVKDFFPHGEKTAVFYNYLPEPPPLGDKLQARARMGIPANAPVVGNAGWLIPIKGFDIFLRTAARLAAKIPDVRFLIAGDGAERQNLEALAEKLNIGKLVVFAGRMLDLRDFWSSIDVLLFNTRFDACPLTPQEAVMHSVPVVASIENSGLYEIVDEKDGFWFRGHDPEKLAAAVAAVLGMSGEERRLLTEKNKRHLVRFVSADRYLHALRGFLDME